MTGEEFKMRREALGYSRLAAATDIGVKKQAVKRWERSTRRVPMYAQRWLAREERRARRRGLSGFSSSGFNPSS